MSTKKKAINIITLGNTKVGKTSLILRYVDNTFNKEIASTLGVDYKTKDLTINGTLVNFQIWDTSGQERFRTVTKGYYSKAMGVILVFDCTDLKSYEEIRGWMMQIENHSKKDIVKYLVAAKCDEEIRQVTIEMGKELAEEYKIPYFETSALTGDNVSEVFDKIANEIFRKRTGSANIKKGNSKVKMKRKSSSDKGKSSCC